MTKNVRISPGNPEKRRQTADRLAGLAAIVLGLMAVHDAVRLVRYRTGEWTGDHVFPILLGISLCAAGLFLALLPGSRQASAGNAPRPAAVSNNANSEHEPEGRALGQMAAVPVLLLGYVALLPLLGYMSATWITAALLFRFVGTFRWTVSVAAALLLTGALDLFFIEWLHTPFPVGRLLVVIKEAFSS